MGLSLFSLELNKVAIGKLYSTRIPQMNRFKIIIFSNASLKRGERFWTAKGKRSGIGFTSTEAGR
ncbi:MAG: hypothetical protein ACUVWV_03220 [Thermodesulfobacteriota bacterium]